MTLRALILAVLVAAGLLHMSAGGRAAEIRVLSAVAVRAPINAVIPDFERKSGHKVNISFEVNPKVKQQIEAGEFFDVALINPEMIVELTTKGIIAAGSQRKLGRIGMGVGIKAGAPRPDLSTVDAFKRSLLAAKSIAYASEGSSGIYFVELLKKLGIHEQMKDRLKSVGGGQTGIVVGRGEAELGVVPITTILAAAPQTELAGLFPAELQSYIFFDLGIGATAKERAAAEAFIAYMTSAEAEATLKAKGIETMK